MAYFAPSMQKHFEIFLFDMEFVGDVECLNTCHTWDLAAINFDSKITYQSYITIPLQDIPPPHEGCFDVSKSFLKQNQARSFREVIVDFLQWLATQVLVKNKQNVLLISHNCFSSDKPLLELEFKRYGIQAPNNIYFMDSLHMLWDHMPKMTSYKLQDVYQSTYKKPMYNAHHAMTDVMALNKIFDTLWYMGKPIEGAVYPFYKTSLRNIAGVGKNTEWIMIFHGVFSLEQLLFEARTHMTQRNSMRNLNMFLLQRFNINEQTSFRVAAGLSSYLH